MATAECEIRRVGETEHEKETPHMEGRCYLWGVTETDSVGGHI